MTDLEEPRNPSPKQWAGWKSHNVHLRICKGLWNQEPLESKEIIKLSRADTKWFINRFLVHSPYPLQPTSNCPCPTTAKCEDLYSGKAKTGFLDYDGGGYHTPNKRFYVTMCKISAMLRLLPTTVAAQSAHSQDPHNSGRQVCEVYTGNLANPGGKFWRYKHYHFSKWLQWKLR